MSHLLTPNITEVSTGSPYTIQTHSGIEEVFLITPDVSSLTVNLPSAATVGAGYKYQIKNLSNTHSVTIEGSSAQKIDNEDTFVLGSQFDSVTIISNGTDEWFII